MKIGNRAVASTGIVSTSAVAFALIALLLSGCASSYPSGDASSGLSGTVSLNGSTSMEKVVGSIAEAFMADNDGVTVTYDATGSGTGIECATNGSCDIGLASRELRENETGLTAITVAQDGIAVIVNEECGVSDLSLEQVAAIFTGEVTNWSDVGGADLAISCIGRERGSGTRDGFESITGTDDACVLEQELTSTGAVITAVSSSPNAIGYASLSSLNGQENVVTLTIEGVACTEQTILEGSYPIRRPFNFVIAESAELSPEAQAFVDFATSPEAEGLIREAGAVPVVAAVE